MSWLKKAVGGVVGGVPGAILGSGKGEGMLKSAWDATVGGGGDIHNPEHYTYDESQYDPARQWAGQARGEADWLGGQYRDMVQGKGPSVAQNQLRSATAENQAQQMAMARSGTGPMGAAGAQYNAARNMASVGQQSARDMATLRAQEQQAAMSGMGNLYGQMRQQDLGQLGQEQDYQLGKAGVHAGVESSLAQASKAGADNRHRGAMGLVGALAGPMGNALGGDGGGLGSDASMKHAPDRAWADTPKVNYSNGGVSSDEAKKQKIARGEPLTTEERKWALDAGWISGTSREEENRMAGAYQTPALPQAESLPWPGSTPSAPAAPSRSWDNGDWGYEDPHNKDVQNAKAMAVLGRNMGEPRAVTAHSSAGQLDPYSVLGASLNPPGETPQEAVVTKAKVRYLGGAEGTKPKAEAQQEKDWAGMGWGNQGNSDAQKSYKTGSQVGGLIMKAAPMIIGAMSDGRAKDAPEEIEGDELDKFMRKLDGFAYKYKEGSGEPTDRNFVGVMAQDVEKSPVGSTIVTEGNDGYKRLDTTHGFGTALAALGRLSERLDKLEKRKG